MELFLTLSKYQQKTDHSCPKAKTKLQFTECSNVTFPYIYLLSLRLFINILSCHFLPLTVFPSASFCCHTLWERTICQGSSSPLFWSSPWEVGGLRELERGERPRWWAGGRADGGRYNDGSWWRDIRWRQHQTPDWLREVPGGLRSVSPLLSSFQTTLISFDNSHFHWKRCSDGSF